MKKSWPTAFTAILLAVSLTACSTEKAAVEPASSSVEVTAVKEVTLDAVYDLSGTLQAYDETPVSFKIGGTVTSVNADIGDQVTKGKSLAQLDSADLQLDLDNANQSVAAAQASLSNAQASLTSAQASLSNAQAAKQAAQAGIASADAQIQSAKVREQGVASGARTQEKAQSQNAVNKAQTAYNQAKTAADRAKTLFDNGLLTQQENEQAQTTLATAQDSLNDAKEQLSLLLEGASASDRAAAASTVKEAEVGRQSAVASVEQANSGIEQANAGIEQANAGISQAQASYEQAVIAKETAQLNLSRVGLAAPVSGVVLEKTISNGQTVTAGTAMFTLGEINKLKVLLPIADSEISKWKVGQQVSLNLYDEARTGKVTKLYPATNENTGSINAEVTIDNPKLDWKPGQVVKASRQAASLKGIAIPVEAVVSTGSEPYVFKNVNGKAVQTPVEIGNLYDNRYQITKGLKVGDQVVTQGADRLFNGDALTVSEATTK